MFLMAESIARISTPRATTNYHIDVEHPIHKDDELPQFDRSFLSHCQNVYYLKSTSRY